MKKCPYCAEEIQDAAIVCKHCGRELGTLSISPEFKYEYKDFSYIWPKSDRIWKYGRVGQDAYFRQDFWDEYQIEIMSKLESEINKGWENVSEIGPGSITVNSLTASQTAALFFTGRPSWASPWIDKETPEKLDVWRILMQSCLAAVLILATMGFIILGYLIVFIFLRAYTPESFSVRLRRHGVESINSGILNERIPVDMDEEGNRVRRQQPETSSPNTYSQITDEERDVFKLIAKGVPNPEIAKMLDMSPLQTLMIKNDLMEKLNVKTVDELIKKVKEMGYIPSE